VCGNCRKRVNLRGRSNVWAVVICFRFSRSLALPRMADHLLRIRVMLRITLPSADRSGIFVLEGRLAGLWAHELLRVARESAQDLGDIFDLREVFYVDSSGEEALRILSRCGARFITDSAYGKDLCKRLRLRRIPASEMRDRQKVEESEVHCGPGHLPRTPKGDPSGAEVLDHQPPRSRQ